MITLRPAEWPADAALLPSLDTGFTTDTVFRVVVDGRSVRLEEVPIRPPLVKRYALELSVDGRLPEAERITLAEREGQLAGVVAAGYQEWNRSLTVHHLYVAPEHRNRGIGARLLAEAEGWARETGARCLWLETQNTNVPAIRFYERRGFRWCGFDDRLYDPAGSGGGEVALYFTRPVPYPRPSDR